MGRSVEVLTQAGSIAMTTCRQLLSRSAGDGWSKVRVAHSPDLLLPSLLPPPLAALLALGRLVLELSAPPPWLPALRAEAVLLALPLPALLPAAVLLALLLPAPPPAAVLPSLMLPALRARAVLLALLLPALRAGAVLPLHVVPSPPPPLTPSISSALQPCSSSSALPASSLPAQPGTWRQAGPSRRWCSCWGWPRGIRWRRYATGAGLRSWRHPGSSVRLAAGRWSGAGP